MNDPTGNTEALVQYHVWDRTVRAFHWVNVLCVIGLVGVGLALVAYYKKKMKV